MEGIASDFTSVLRTHNESFDQNMLEFRSLESNSFRTDCQQKSNSSKDKSYSEEVKAFIKRVIDRQTTTVNNFTRVNSSTPFKLCGNNEIDVSGIDYLNVNSRKKLMSLNDSDFESMDQDRYDDSKENIEFENKINESRVKSIKKLTIPTLKSASSAKKTKNSRISPHKSRKWKKLTKMNLTRENLCKYLTTNDDNEKLTDSFICEPPSSSSDNEERDKISSNYIAFNTSLDYLTEQLHLAPACDANSCNFVVDTAMTLNEHCEIINNESLCEFTFSQPNTTKTSEASIKMLSQLSVVSNYSIIYFLLYQKSH